MLSTDLENLASALEEMSGEFSKDNAIFLELVCSNLLSLAQRVHMLEAIPVTPPLEVLGDDWKLLQ